MADAATAWHGHCYGFESERATWAKPELVVESKAEARPGYDSMDASEYTDVPETLHAKVCALARLIRQARCCLVYTGAGLSTGAGIGDYASKEGSTAQALPSEGPSSFRSPLCAQPTSAHRVLIALHARGHMHRWINQNHDGLPQKAGLPQEAINEIHGAWHAPDNSVVQMSGSLRDDLFADLLACEAKADLTIAIGTSLCGMNSDRVVAAPARRAAQGEKGQFGSVVIGLQRTVLDDGSTLRIFGRCDDVCAALALELELEVAPAWEEGAFFTPAVFVDRHEDDFVFEGVPYNASGERSEDTSSTLDLRDDVELVIPSGMHAGAVGVVDGCDREGNVRCRFKLRPKVGKLRAPVMMLLGRWWIQAAVDGTVPLLPVVNKPIEEMSGAAAERIRTLMEKYAAP